MTDSLLIKELIQLLAATIGSIGFALVFNIPAAKLKWAAIGGCFSWACYLVCKHLGMHEYMCGLIAAALTTVYSEIVARFSKAPAIIYIVVSTVPLIPGAALYRSMYALLRQDYLTARAQGLYALLFASSMAAGIVMATLAEKTVTRS